MGWRNHRKSEHAAEFVPGSSIEGGKLSRWAVAKPHLSAASSPTTSSLTLSSALSLRHACWPVAVPSRRGSVHATEPSPKRPTSSLLSPTRATHATRKFVPQRKGRGLQADPSRPTGWLQATRQTTTTATTAVFLGCRIPANPLGVMVCVCVCVYLLNCT